MLLGMGSGEITPKGCWVMDRNSTNHSSSSRHPTWAALMRPLQLPGLLPVACRLLPVHSLSGTDAGQPALPSLRSNKQVGKAIGEKKVKKPRKPSGAWVMARPGPLVCAHEHAAGCL
jgi:hypothetical protein